MNNEIGKVEFKKDDTFMQEAIIQLNSRVSLMNQHIRQLEEKVLSLETKVINLENSHYDLNGFELQK